MKSEESIQPPASSGVRLYTVQTVQLYTVYSVVRLTVGRETPGETQWTVRQLGRYSETVRHQWTGERYTVRSYTVQWLAYIMVTQAREVNSIHTDMET